ncbi:MAG: hypothetical protein ACK4TA_21260 [Saprospiraceae bacterium]
MHYLKLSLFFILFLVNTVNGQDTTALKAYLLGKWELTKYAEQGVQVDKQQNAATQAQTVYQHVSEQRVLLYYGYDVHADERRTRAFERWQAEDRTQETNRITQAVAMPYYVAFFADSTLATYNKDTLGTYFPESWHFTFVPQTMSIDIGYPNRGGVRWHAQVLTLTRERLVLFLPEDAEVVELVKVNNTFP